MDPSSLDHGTQPDAEYEEQFLWDNNKQEPIMEIKDKPPMVSEGESGEKRKATKQSPHQENKENR
eukprot:10392508-Ditylum_brightwellii.AAC.1